MNKRKPAKKKNAKQVHKSGFVALVGPANAGKSTLLNRFVGSKVSIVSPKEQTTRNRILGIRTTRGAQIVFLDTPGFMAKKYRGELARHIGRVFKDTAADAELSVLVVDAVKLSGSESAVIRLRAALKERKIPRLEIVALNKIDRIAKPQLLPLLAKLNQLFIDYCEQNQTEYPELVPVSALKGDGLDILEQVIIKRLPEGPEYFPKEMVSDQTDQFLAAEIIREKLTLGLEEELPYSLAVSVEEWRREGKMLHLGALILVEKPSQKGIVIGKEGAKLKSIGQAARRELERILGERIFLELFVRVEPNWTRTKHGLESAGYSADNPD